MNFKKITFDFEEDDETMTWISRSLPETEMTVRPELKKADSFNNGKHHNLKTEIPLLKQKTITQVDDQGNIQKKSRVTRVRFFFDTGDYSLAK